MQKNGRSGQSQQGVDLFGRRHATDQWVGVQCKVKSSGEKLRPAEIDAEVKKARSFNPHLSELIIATTAPRDANAQAHARVVTARHRRTGSFSVHIASWSDITETLALPEYSDIFVLFFKGIMLDATTCGSAVGVMVALEMGVGQKADTRHEFILGRTPIIPEREGYEGLNYYKNCYFIANLPDRRFTVFRLPLHPSDLQNVFTTGLDRYIVCEWINSLGERIDDLIRGKQVKTTHLITTKQWRKFAKIR